MAPFSCVGKEMIVEKYGYPKLIDFYRAHAQGTKNSGPPRSLFYDISFCVGEEKDDSPFPRHWFSRWFPPVIDHTTGNSKSGARKCLIKFICTGRWKVHAFPCKRIFLCCKERIDSAIGLSERGAESYAVNIMQTPLVKVRDSEKEKEIKYRQLYPPTSNGRKSCGTAGYAKSRYVSLKLWTR